MYMLRMLLYLVVEESGNEFELHYFVLTEEH